MTASESVSPSKPRHDQQLALTQHPLGIVAEHAIAPTIVPSAPRNGVTGHCDLTDDALAGACVRIKAKLLTVQHRLEVGRETACAAVAASIDACLPMTSSAR